MSIDWTKTWEVTEAGCGLEVGNLLRFEDSEIKVKKGNLPYTSWGTYPLALSSSTSICTAQVNNEPHTIQYHDSPMPKSDTLTGTDDAANYRIAGNPASAPPTDTGDRSACLLSILGGIVGVVLGIVISLLLGVSWAALAGISLALGVTGAAAARLIANNVPTGPTGSSWTAVEGG